jgi:endo-1,3(4)-beta-glucanase
MVALIADQIENSEHEEGQSPEISSKAASTLEAALRPWLDGTNDDAVVYDSTWGGLVTTAGLQDPLADFGNGYYNDHHFHYGYLVFAAAAVLHLKPSTALKDREAFKRQALAFALDIANPIPSSSTDSSLSSSSSSYSSTLFPIARHKDFFDGHSWASGLFYMADGKSQESVSEAINAYYAVSLFARALLEDGKEGDQNTAATELLDFSRLLLSMELDAAQFYWQMPQANTKGDKDDGKPWVYPARFAEANKMAAVVGASDVNLKTWFGDGIEYAHCINMVPFTAITTSLLFPSFVREEFPLLKQRALHGGASDQWRGFIYQDEAVIDKAKSWTDIMELFGDPAASGSMSRNGRIDDGASLSAMLYWAATRGGQGEHTHNTQPAESRVSAGLV